MNTKLNNLIKFLDQRGIEVEDAIEINGDIQLMLGLENVYNRSMAIQIIMRAFKAFNKIYYTTPVYVVGTIKFEKDNFGGVAIVPVKFSE